MNSRTKEIGRRIALIRVHRMMTQAALAAAIGVSRDVIFHIEKGHTPLDIDQAERLAAAMRCSIDDLRAPLEAAIPRIRMRTQPVRVRPVPAADSPAPEQPHGSPANGR
jgi:DNA-binding XRE family transcriptional regulator